MAVALTEALRPVLGADGVLSVDRNASTGRVVKELGVEFGAFVGAFYGKGGGGVWHVQNVIRFDLSPKA